MKNKNLKIVSIIGLITLVAMSCSKKTSTSNDADQTLTKPIGQRQGGAPSFEALLAKMDVNKDGKLAKAEAKGPLAADFDTIDSNKDGFITAAEISNAPRMQGRKPQGGQRPPR